MPIYKITRKGLYLRVNGKLQKMEPGTEMEVADSIGETWVNRGFAEKPEIKKPKKAKKQKKSKKVDSD